MENGDIIRHNDGDAHLLEGGKHRRITNGVTYECVPKESKKVVNGVLRGYIDDISLGA